MRKNCVEVIAFNGIKWLSETNVNKQLGHGNLVVITSRYIQNIKKNRRELVDEPEKQSNRILLHGRIAIAITMDCRIVEACNFKRRLEFKLLDVINTKQQTISKSTKDTFEGENMKTGYYQSGHRTDLYFHDYRLAIEVDEFGYCNRDIEYEKERERDTKRKA